MDDVATAAGINKLNNVPNYAWAASDLAQQKTQDAMLPLIEQLCERAVYIMKRLTYPAIHPTPFLITSFRFHPLSLLIPFPSTPIFDTINSDVVEKIADSRRKKWQSSMRDSRVSPSLSRPPQLSFSSSFLTFHYYHAELISLLFIFVILARRPGAKPLLHPSREGPLLQVRGPYSKGGEREVHG